MHIYIFLILHKHLSNVYQPVVLCIEYVVFLLRQQLTTISMYDNAASIRLSKNSRFLSSPLRCHAVLTKLSYRDSALFRCSCDLFGLISYPQPY